MRSYLQLFGVVLALSGAPASPLDLTIITDEAEAALAILELRAADKSVPPDAWRRLFESEGYRRLKARETAMGRAFEDSTFRAFLVSDTLLARAPSLRRSLRHWEAAQFEEAAGKALAYLPRGTPIRAKVYLLIKPKPNSFVFEADSDPAIMFYLDPSRTRAQLENTVAHELHHIGYAAACRSSPDAAADSAVSTARQWLSAFGEGIAMLAAAGGPKIHPHATSPLEDRARWDRDLANAPADFRRVETFLLDVVDRRLADPDSISRVAMGFFGVQGPWYTLGWLMGATVERDAGRAGLVGLLCDPVDLLTAYNAAARRDGRARLPLWSDALLARLTSGSRVPRPRRRRRIRR
jgi:hypothetical protein